MKRFPKSIFQSLSWKKALRKVAVEYSNYSLTVTMVVSFRVYKKSSPNGKLTVYLGRRDFVDHVSKNFVKNYLFDFWNGSHAIPL